MPRIQRQKRSAVRRVPQSYQQDGPATQVGSTVGRLLGSLAGRLLGTGAYRRRVNPLVRSKPRMITGSGAYSVAPRRVYRGRGAYENAPGSSSELIQPLPPKFLTASPEEGVIISHREYLGDIITHPTPGLFRIDTFAINPSDVNCFPWLSQIALPNFQQYIMESCIFEFRSFSADALNSTNTALGAVFSCVNYDYSDQDFVSRLQMENTDWANCSKPSESFIVPIECKRNVTGNGGLYYILNGSTVPTGADPKQYYIGKLSIATQGMQGASVNVGSLYVTYKVRLLKPFMSAPLSAGLIVSQSRTNCTNAIPCGTSNNSGTHYCDSIGVTYTNTTITLNKKRLLPGMQLMVHLGWAGSAAAGLVCPNLAVSSNAQGLSYFGGIVGFTTPQGAINDTRVSMAQIISVENTNSDVVLTFSGATLPAATCNLSVNICQISGQMFSQIGTYTP